MTEEARKTAKAMHQNECEDCVFNPTKLGCRWRKKGMYCDTALHSAADLIESLSAQFEQVTRERDAAVKDINKVLHKSRFYNPECGLCHMKVPECNWNCEDAHWRGVREVEG